LPTPFSTEHSSENSTVDQSKLI